MQPFFLPEIYIEKVENVENIAKELINIGLMAKTENPNAGVLISEIPIRKDYFDKRRGEVNDLLRKSLPKSLNIVSHENFTHDMLYGRKHIKENSIHHLVRNVKNKVRELVTLENKININNDVGEKI